MKSGMKQTVIGKIPEDWEVAKLGETGRIVSGATPDTKVAEFWNGAIAWCTPTDITALKGKVYFSRTHKQISDSGLRNSSASLLPVGSLVICTRATLGDCAINLVPMTTNQGFKSIVPNEDWDVNFLYYLINNSKEVIKRLSSGSTFLEISKKAFENIDIPFPPLSEQQKIAEVLSTVDEKMAVMDEQLAQTHELKKGLMQRLLTKGIGHTAFKDSPLGEIPESWEAVELGSASDITRLAGYEYSEYWKEDPQGAIMSLRGYNIGRNTIVHRDIVRISNDLSLQLNRSRLNKGDVVFPCVGTIGNAVVIEESDKYHINQNIAKLTPKKTLSPYYLVHYLMSDICKSEIRRLSASSSQPNVLVGSLRKFRIALPSSLEEQASISEVFSTIDKKLQVLTDKKSQYQELKRGLMQQLLTGQRRVRLEAELVTVA